MNQHRMLRMVTGVILVALSLAGCGAPAASPTPSVGVPTTAARTATPTARPAVATATPVPSPAADPLIEAIADLAATDQFAGAVLIAKDGAPVHVVAHGLARRSPDVPNQTDTKYNLGSMDKMFTAVAILQLVERGRLSLDGRISDYWPDYPNQEVAGKVTIHHLLVHTSGMGDCFEGDFFTTPKDQLRTLEGYLPLFVDDPLQFEPGTQFAYSNEGYIVLGSIIEKVTGQSYWDYVRENIYRPSGMSQTAAYELDAEVPNRAIGYTTQDAQGNETGTLADNTPLMPIKGTSAGGGYSTVEDLLNFSNALLGYRLLGPESTELLLAGKVEVREGSRYAYGFFDRTIGGQRVVGHGGGAPGVCTFMYVFLDSGYTVIVLSNTDQGCFPVLEFLQEHPFAPSAAAPSPLPGGNEGLIAFYSEREGNAEIYTIHADGSAETRLTQNRALDIAPDVSPDGSQIVFVSNRDGNEEIYRMNSDGSDVVRLTTAPAKDSYPFWSSDGTKIIFCSQRDDGHTYEVYLMDSDGTDPTRITNNSVSEEWAYLSPDMQKIVYAVGPFPDYSLYVMNVDGSDSHQVFSSDKSAAFPKWSRDGGTIAFNHVILSSGNIIGDICLTDADGGDFRQMTTTGGDLVSESPYWSPDGSRIVFQSNRTGNFQIYVMNADGSNTVRLTNHHGNDYYPSWGPTATPTSGSILFEKSAQTFAAVPTYQIGLADLDGDGDLDMEADSSPIAVSSWGNTGMGSTWAIWTAMATRICLSTPIRIRHQAGCI